tara:strand:+ start:344 stop:718 length:375 start_codon:yes stop_codon:yes gene_type:complete
MEAKTLIEIAKITVLMVVIDSLYLFFIKNRYGQMIANIQKSPMNVKICGAVLSYSMVVAGFYIFGYRENLSATKTFLLGFIMYGLYETTSYALFDNWEIWALIIDSLWGGLLYLLTKIVLDRFL